MRLFDPVAVANRVAAQWGSQPLLRDQPCPVPSELATVLEAAHLASMQTEEGRSLRFGLILRRSDEPIEREFSGVRFDVPRPLSTEELRRLAPATGLTSTFIAIEWAEGRPYIWGTLDVGSKWSSFRAAESSSGLGLPFNLFVSVAAPGTIRLSFSDSLMFATDHGMAAEVAVNVLKDGPVHDFLQPAVLALLEEALPEMPSSPDLPYTYGGEYRRFLARTLHYGEESGHGGAVVVVRDCAVEELKNLVTIKYQTSGHVLWEDMKYYLRAVFEEINLGHVVNSDKQSVSRAVHDSWRQALNRRDNAERVLSDRSRFLARLMQVDGALILTDRLRVLGFGAVVTDLSGEPQPTWRCSDARGTSLAPFSVSSHGTRHRAAISLASQSDCVAFVLSQDGGVKAITRRANDILVWPAVALDPSSWFITADDLLRSYASH